MTYAGIMSDNTKRPDRSGASDFDDSDIPTYREETPTVTGPAVQPRDAAVGPADTETGSTSAAIGDPYSRAGQAAPQEIPPQGSPAETTAFSGVSGEDYADRDFAVTEQAPPPPGLSVPAQAASVPVGSTATAVAGSEYFQGASDAMTPDARRGTMDLGLLIIRLLLGLWLVLVSLATFFQLGGNEGIAGLESAYSGYLAPEMLAIAIPAIQLAAGVFLVFGLITPVFAMLATVATSFTFLHEIAVGGGGYNIFTWTDSALLSLVLLGVSLALQFTGPGLYSLDVNRSWARRPLFSSWIFVVLAIAGGVALWWFGAGANPF